MLTVTLLLLLVHHTFTFKVIPVSQAFRPALNLLVHAFLTIQTTANYYECAVNDDALDHETIDYSDLDDRIINVGLWNIYI